MTTRAIGRRDGVVTRAVSILRCFGPEDLALPLSELVRRTGLPKGTVHRLAADLVSEHLLDKTAHGYRLAGGLFELGMRAATERTLLELAMPFLQDLYERTHETVHLGVRDGSDVVYVAKIGGHLQARTPSRPGGRMPMHCTAIGKVLLAHASQETRNSILAGRLERRTPRTIVAPGVLQRQLAAVVETGIAFEHEESALGLVCIASPVLDRDGSSALAAISIAGPVGRLAPKSHAPALRAAASRLSAVLARRPG